MDLVQQIKNKKLECVILSPHQDDAVLSCGELLQQLSGKTKITIVNIFTQAHGKPYTLSTKQFLKASDYKDALTLYEERQKEDKKVLSPFTVTIEDLGLEDALFRRKKVKTMLGKIMPEFSHVYPTYRWHIIKKIAKNDTALKELKTYLKQFKKDNVLIFAPYGIGNHVDHILTRKAAEGMFDNLILYSDFPYNMRERQYGKSFRNGDTYRIKPDMKQKIKLIKGYKTQFKGLFPNGKVDQHEEIFFSKIKI